MSGPLLIVDDEADLRESLQEYLQDHGYLVRTATNGQEALEVMSGDQVPCVVILDLIMPVMNGREVYERMQQDARLATVPVIVSTSDPSRAPAGVPTLRKPYDLRRLLAVVQTHCTPLQAP
ncbi:MAG TPA: response regulator [Kofleriaceae bacterium]|nr:response regulator [Kofleriaceae bacterium]